MRRTLTKTDITLINMRNNMIEFYNYMRDFVRDLKRKDKKLYKQCQKNTKNFMDLVIHYTTDIQSLTSELLGMTFQTEEEIKITTTKNYDLTLFSKDTDFSRYVKTVMSYYLVCLKYSGMYQMDSNRKVIEYNFLGENNIVLSYFLVSEKKPTEQKLLNTLSFLFKNSIIKLSLRDMTEENKEKIRMITTGIKYEKERQSVNNINYEREQKRKKSNKFDFLQYLSTRITIKYLSKRDYNHRFHKRPIEHIRKGHYRHYKNGSVVWVGDSVVNEGLVS